MNNPAFNRALHAISHPASLASLLILLLNDHLLKHLWPSWLTGKLSDFAGLVFFPFVLTALLAWVTPTRWGKQPNYILGLAVGLTGMVFILCKTIPEVNALINQTLTGFLGLPVRFALDPSDMMALPIFWSTWRIWERSSTEAISYPVQNCLVLLIAALLSLGSSPNYQTGISCLHAENNKLYALYDYTYQVLSSQDGGLTWQETKENVLCQSQQSYPLSLKNRPEVLFQQNENAIEQSNDHGQTWQVVFTLQPENELTGLLYDYEYGHWSHSSYSHLRDALLDPQSQNIILAMGLKGILVNDGGRWQWVAAGEYQILKPESYNLVEILIQHQLWLALAIGLLYIASTTYSLSRRGFWKFWFWLAWITWGMCVFLFTPSFTGYEYLFKRFGTPILLVLVGCLGLESWGKILAHILHTAKTIALWSLLTAGAFAAPYVLWILNIIPFYNLALFLSLVLVLIIFRFKRIRSWEIVEEATSNKES